MQKNRQKAEEAVALRQSFITKREVCDFCYDFYMRLIPFIYMRCLGP